MIASYDVLLIDAATGAIGPADYSTPDREEALAFAEGFNRAELDQPLGCWAIISQASAGDNDEYLSRL